MYAVMNNEFIQHAFQNYTSEKNLKC